MSQIAIQFLTRSGCSLCDHAKPMVDRIARRRGVTVEEVDVDESGLADRYGSRVPVVLAPDGTVLAEGRIQRRALSRAMKVWMA